MGPFSSVLQTQQDEQTTEALLRKNLRAVKCVAGIGTSGEKDGSKAQHDLDSAYCIGTMSTRFTRQQMRKSDWKA